MRVEIALLLLLVYLTIATALDNCLAVDFSDARRCQGIDFEASDMMTLPKMSLADGAKEAAPFSSLPILSSNQSITPTLLLGQNCSASDVSNISVCLSSFNITSFLAGLPVAANVSRENCAKVLLDNNNDFNNSSSYHISGFQILNAESGMYTAYVIDENRSEVLNAAPLLIIEGKIILQTPDKVMSEEPFIQVKMNTTAQENQSKFFAAIMISRRDYENISLSLSKNESSEYSDLILSMGDKSLLLPFPPKISSELLMDMLPLLPQNSAVGLQESPQPGVDLILMTDKPWEKGEYILTSAVYSSAKGLLGIKQNKIEVI